MIIQSANIYHVPTGSRKAVLLELVTDAGITGAGEAGIAYGAGGSATAEMLRELVERFVLQRDASRIAAIWHEIYDRSFWTRNGGAIHYAAMSAIEQALWDIRGKHLDAPLHELFGGRLRERLPVYANGWWVGCNTADDYAAAATTAVDRGLDALKFYPLATTDSETVVRHPAHRGLDNAAARLAVERVAAVREAVGADIELMLDFGGGLCTDLVLRICRRIEPLDILFVEEAVDPGSPGALAEVAAGTSIALAAGERCFGRQGFAALIDVGAVGILQPDVCNTGGFSEARMIASMAEVANLRIAPHNYGSTLATVVAAQFAAVIPNLMMLEYFPDFEREPGYLAVIEEPLEARVENGAMPLPNGPGLGVRLLRENLQPFLLVTLKA